MSTPEIVIEPQRPDAAAHDERERHCARPGNAVARILLALPLGMMVYGAIRFFIIRSRILASIDIALPNRGRILELGCGIGIFAAFLAAQAPVRSIVGVDRDAKRIAVARRIGGRTGLPLEFETVDVRELPPSETFDAAYMVDVVHHIPRDHQLAVLRDVRARLAPGGILVVKDIATEPRYKLTFTRALDRMMAPRDELAYRPPREFVGLLEEAGYRDVRVRYLDDPIPFPHVLYVCSRA